MKKIINFRPVFLLSLVFACGIVAAWLFCLKKFFFATALAVLICGGLIAYALIFKKKAALRVIIAAVAFVLGMSVMSVQSSVLIGKRMYLKEVVLTGTVTDNYRMSIGYGNYKRYDMLLRNCSADGEALNGTVRVKTGSTADFKPGDVLTFKCRLNDTQLLKSSPSTVDYRNKTFWEAVDVSGEIVRTSGKLKPDEKMRTYAKNTFNLLLDETNAGTATAIVLGDKSGMDRNVNESFRLAGVAHIFAVSGLHVGFIVLMFNWLLRKLKVNNYAALVVTALATVAYAWICGFSASVLRAVVMSAVVMITRTTGRQPDVLSSLGLSAFLILLFRPLYITDAGFLLSFASVFGIATVTAALTRLIRKIKPVILKKAASGFAVSLGASLGAFPLIVLFYGNFSIIGLLFNVVAVPAVTVLFIGLLLTLIPPFFALAIPLNFSLTLLTKAAALFGGLPFSAVGLNPLSFGALFFFLLLFLLGGFVLIKKKKTKLITAGALAVAMIVSALLSGIPPVSRNEITFFDGGGFAVSGKEGGHLIFGNIESYEQTLKIAEYCKKHGLKEIDVYVTDFSKVSPYYTEILSEKVKVKTVSGNVNGVETTRGVGGLLYAVKIDVGGKTVLYIVNAANANIVMEKYPTADIVITDTDIPEVWDFYGSVQKVCFGYFDGKQILFPRVSGNFTLRIKRDRIATVR